jgi:hypothetical protein
MATIEVMRTKEISDDIFNGNQMCDFFDKKLHIKVGDKVHYHTIGNLNLIEHPITDCEYLVTHVAFNDPRVHKDVDLASIKRIYH